MTERLGKEFKDVRFEKRIREIEKGISGGALTAREGDVDLDDGIPQVVGLSLSPGAGRGIAIRWNDANVTQADLDFYEVQFATNAGFTAGVQTYKTKDLQFTFSEGDPNTTYFARVRVALNSGDVGDYSITLNTSTGQAVTEDIEENAVTTPSSVFTDGTTTVLNLTSDVVQTLVVDKDGSDLYIIAEVTHAHNGNVAAIAEVMNFYVRKDSTEVIASSPNSGSTSRPFIAVLIFPDTSGSVGSTTYDIFIDNVNILGLDAIISKRKLTALELKR